MSFPWGRARTLLPTFALGLMACSTQDCDNFNRGLQEFFIFVLVLLILGFIVQVTSLVVLIVCIVKLQSHAPSRGWGVAALVTGILLEGGMLFSLLAPSPLTIFWLAFGMVMIYVGVRHLQLAKLEPQFPVPEILPPRPPPPPGPPAP
jgi:hypothetical protein